MQQIKKSKTIPEIDLLIRYRYITCAVIRENSVEFVSLRDSYKVHEHYLALFSQTEYTNLQVYCSLEEIFNDFDYLIKIENVYEDTVNLGFYNANNEKVCFQYNNKTIESATFENLTHVKNKVSFIRCKGTIIFINDNGNKDSITFIKRSYTALDGRISTGLFNVAISSIAELISKM